MRTVTVGTAILGLGILAALPFRHRTPPIDQRNARVAASAMPQPSVMPLQEVPLEQFVQQQQWALPDRRTGGDADRSPQARWPRLPESYTEVAVPLATPQVLAERFSATTPLRGAESGVSLPPAAGSASQLAANDPPRDPWHRDLPLGQPLRGAAAVALRPVWEQAPEEHAARAGMAPGAAAGASFGASTDHSSKPWPSPDQIAKAARAEQQAAMAEKPAADRTEQASVEPETSAKPAGHAITAVSVPLPKHTAQAADAAAEEDARQRFYIREPVR